MGSAGPMAPMGLKVSGVRASRRASWHHGIGVFRPEEIRASRLGVQGRGGVRAARLQCVRLFCHIAAW
eukprot:7834160-Pyramimonas_sp.AAC.1